MQRARTALPHMVVRRSQGLDRKQGFTDSRALLSQWATQFLARLSSTQRTPRILGGFGHSSNNQ